jgi:hypothetical protein
MCVLLDDLFRRLVGVERVHEAERDVHVVGRIQVLIKVNNGKGPQAAVL